MKKPKLTSTAATFVANFNSFSLQTMEEKIRGFVNKPEEHSVVQDFLNGISKAGADPYHAGEELMELETSPETGMTPSQKEVRKNAYAKLITEAKNPKKSSFRNSSPPKKISANSYQGVIPEDKDTSRELEKETELVAN